MGYLKVYVSSDRQIIPLPNKYFYLKSVFQLSVSRQNVFNEMLHLLHFRQSGEHLMSK